MRDAERERERERERDRQRKKQAPCREPYVGLNPRSPESHPEPKTDAQLLSHPGVPYNMSLFFFQRFYLFIHKRHRERCRDMVRRRSRLLGEPGEGLNPWIPGL